ncbi:preprotein translocase subunit YajC [Yinghuangia aomiensis]
MIRAAARHRKGTVSRREHRQPSATSAHLRRGLSVHDQARARRRQQEAAQTQQSLRPGSEVRTIAGLFATVTEVEDDTVVLEIAPDVHCRYLKSAIAAVLTTGDDAEDEHEDEHDGASADAGDHAAASDDHEDSVDLDKKPENGSANGDRGEQPEQVVGPVHRRWPPVRGRWAAARAAAAGNTVMSRPRMHPGTDSGAVPRSGDRRRHGTNREMGEGGSTEIKHARAPRPGVGPHRGDHRGPLRADVRNR